MLILSLSEAGMAAGDADAGDAWVGVIPAHDVALHRLQLLEATPAARAEEIRMRATDLAGQPLDDLHMATGPISAEGQVWLALIDHQAMAGHVAACAAAGSEPVAILPAPLLLPDAPQPAAALLDGRLLIRTPDMAASVDPALGPLLGVDGPVPAFIPGPVPADTPNLLSGPYAPRLSWWRQRGLRLAALLLAAAIAALLILPPALDWRAQSAAVADHDAATRELAAGPLGQVPADAAEAAAALAAARTTAESGTVGARLTHAADVLAASPGARLVSARLEGDALRLELVGSAAAINQARARFGSGPFMTGGEGSVLLLGARQPIPPLSDSPADVAMARRIAAMRDAAILEATATPQPGAGTALGQLVSDAGLEARTDGAALLIAAARPGVLLPLLVEAEAGGARFREAELAANVDRTISARLVPAP